MSRKLTDEQIRAEINELKDSPDVKLARLELRQRYRERQRLYSLRNLAKRGAELRSQGVTIESLYAMEHEAETDELLMAAEDE